MQKVLVAVRALLTIHCIFYSGGQISAAKTLADRLSLNNIKALDKLCPRVDICIRNASEAVVRRNRILDDGKQVSKCHGCSCHKDCRGMLNCCFPDDRDEVVDDSVAVTPPLANNSPDNHTTTSGTIDNVITPGDGTTPMRQCAYLRTGVPEHNWRDEFPTYRIVSEAPAGGCKSIGQSSLGNREDPCGSGNVAPWGDDLYPVYSRNHGVIYKNSLCASCHGAYEYEHMEAVLVCDIQDEMTERFLSVLDHLQFLQQDGSSQYCFISFEYKDTAMLYDNRCFVDTLNSCSEDFNEGNLFRIPDGVNITHTEVRNACHSGLKAPVLVDHAYRNAFCAICNGIWNLRSLQDKYGYYSHSKAFRDRKTAYLLDLSVLLNYERQEKSAGKTAPYPEVCLYDGASREKESCRELFCPSGQLRQQDGLCRYPSRTWYTEFFEITVKLTHVKGNQTVDDLLNAGLCRTDDIFKHISASSPWPSRWEVNRVLLSSDDSGTGPEMVVELVVDIKNPSLVFQALRFVMARPWILSINGIDIVYKQSFFEYSLQVSTTGILIPKWKVNVNESLAQIVNSAAITFWNINPNFKINPNAFRISKLFTCESVFLRDGEYTLIANDLVLMNNLTGEILFDREFEMVGQENGRLSPRVCATDTPITLNSSHALSLSGNALPFVLVTCMGLYRLN